MISNKIYNNKDSELGNISERPRPRGNECAAAENVPII
jgi:hypothetical protein